MYYILVQYSIISISWYPTIFIKIFSSRKVDLNERRSATTSKFSKGTCGTNGVPHRSGNTAPDTRG